MSPRGEDFKRLRRERQAGGLLTASEVADALRLHVNTVKRIPVDQLPYVRIVARGDRRYQLADVHAYLERRKARHAVAGTDLAHDVTAGYDAAIRAFGEHADAKRTVGRSIVPRGVWPGDHDR
jgi:hypothetical protein